MVKIIYYDDTEITVDESIDDVLDAFDASGMDDFTYTLSYLFETKACVRIDDLESGLSY